jgi:hypothetical protein
MNEGNVTYNLYLIQETLTMRLFKNSVIGMAVMALGVASAVAQDKNLSTL